MVDFVDIQYAQMLSGRLDNWRIKHTSPYRINFRCPICGDSKKKRSLARGWLLERDNVLVFYCHNCHASQGFSYFLKGQDQQLYNDYVAEKFVKKANTSIKTTSVDDDKWKASKPVFKKKYVDPLSKIKKVSSLKFDHPVKRYIEKRKIPAQHHYRLYYAQKFQAWINEVVPNKFPNIIKDEPRLVIPFIDEDGKCFGVSARSFDPNTSLRYIIIMFEDKPKIFGLDKVDMNQPYYIVEGAIDSMFLSNAIAMNGAEGNSNSANQNAVYVFDAEPRNKEIHARMEKVIKNGYKICIWPTDVPAKDINDMYLNGLTEVEKLIEENTYQGLVAELKLSAWRKT
jgi:transcription elongation factor Elf1